MNPPHLTLAGERFHRLTAITFVGMNKFGKSTWLCRCDCGNQTIVIGSQLLNGNTTSCGKCVAKRPLSHGAARVGKVWPEYKVWAAMLARCNNPNSDDFEYYGKRGISVCDRWHSFACFIEDMGRRPSRELTIERKNNDGNYELGNCHWATRLVQARNRRPYTKRIAA